MAHVRGQASPVYRVPRAKSPGTDAIWPPEKYCKLAITFEGDDGEIGEWAFCDPRRLGRIKLVDADESELTRVPPLGDLGADPLLAMPSVDTLADAFAKRSAPIKAVLLDQNGVRRCAHSCLIRLPVLATDLSPSIAASVWHWQYVEGFYQALIDTLLNLCRTDYMVDEILYQAAIVSLLHVSSSLARLRYGTAT